DGRAAWNGCGLALTRAKTHSISPSSPQTKCEPFLRAGSGGGTMAVHHFTPTRYYTAIGTYEPVLRIADGDTVITTTVDAGGGDAANNPVTPGGNPQTGPFYVE